MYINQFFTHMEVYPYRLGSCRQLEKYHSVWNIITHQYVPKTMYWNGGRLYLPRGTSVDYLLERFPDASVTNFMNPDDWDMFPSPKLIPEPRDQIQEDAIKFLMCEDRFYVGNKFTQFGLNLDTGDGKTACMIAAICRYRMKAIIICHQTKIKEQWINEIRHLTSIPEDRVIDIEGIGVMEKVFNQEIIGDIYIVNHQSIHSYASKYGWLKVREFFKVIKVGMKIYDEAHLFFENIFMIDCFSNTRKTFYVSATFEKGSFEKTIFKRAFSNVYRFGEETRNYAGKRKHVIYIAYKFRSHPTDIDFINISRSYFQFSIFAYTDYAIKDDKNKTILRVLLGVLDQFEDVRGRILIVVAKKEACEIIKDFIDKEVMSKTVGFVHSGQSDEQNKYALEKDIIVSTSSSMGTGVNIKGLRIIINMEPQSSPTKVIQLKGRLREFSPTDDTYFIDLVDISINEVVACYEKRKKTLSKSVKEIKDCLI